MYRMGRCGNNTTQHLIIIHNIPCPGSKGGQSAENTAENPLALLLESDEKRICISPLSADNIMLVGSASVKSGPAYNCKPVLSPSYT